MDYYKKSRTQKEWIIWAIHQREGWLQMFMWQSQKVDWYQDFPEQDTPILP